MRPIVSPLATLSIVTALLGWQASAQALEIKLPQETAQLKASTLAGHQATNSWCVMCHSIDYIKSQPPMSSAFWNAEVTKMIKVYGAPIPADQVPLISEYLGKTYGTDSGK
ncbi:sulfite:cytochrome C oxidoreductase subunit B [Pandoraea terrae]|uniref:Sulfite:cytochrome C oxidoreductase subunit B n=1 Tax=Pandoraea terrae TaxID=1537710 RepID=A0A5E4YIA6_9BURK|nr:sulfite:cytochrome C oxidoreductase subunit B [Pandoraea terrae]VVE48474.1 sulfite:cytochrome C oxidoreductase subunit B [Pandoraea terrae]